MDEIAKMDMTTFPREDPVTTAKRQKEADKLREMQKQESRAENSTAKRVSKAKRKSVSTPAAALGGDQRERVIILRKLSQYYAKLGKKINVAKPRTWPSDLKKLRELLLSVETDLAANGGIDQAGALYIQGVVAQCAVCIACSI